MNRRVTIAAQSLHEAMYQCLSDVKSAKFTFINSVGYGLIVTLRTPKAGDETSMLSPFPEHLGVEATMIIFTNNATAEAALCEFLRRETTITGSATAWYVLPRRAQTSNYSPYCRSHPRVHCLGRRRFHPSPPVRYPRA